MPDVLGWLQVAFGWLQDVPGWIHGIFDFILNSGGGDVGIIFRAIVVIAVALPCLYYGLIILSIPLLLLWALVKAILDSVRGVKKGLRAVRGRDRSVSIPRYAGRGLSLAGAEIMSVAVQLIQMQTPDRDLTRELGKWPTIYRRSYGFVLKARFLSPQWVHFPNKASAWTGGICFFLGTFGTSVDVKGIITGAVVGFIAATVSRPFYGLMASSRLVVVIEASTVSWRCRKQSGYLRGAEGDWQIEANPQHPSGPEEQRLHNEAVRTGAVKPDTPYEPAYHNASLLVARSGYRLRDWQIIAEIAGDFQGRRAMLLQTAIQRLHEQSLKESRTTQRTQVRQGPAREMR